MTYSLLLADDEEGIRKVLGITLALTALVGLAGAAWQRGLGLGAMLGRLLPAAHHGSDVGLGRRGHGP